jgi:hypothetical protein
LPTSLLIWMQRSDSTSRMRSKRNRDDVVIDAHPRGDDRVVVGQVFLGLKVIRRQRVFAPESLQGPIALQGKPPPEGKTDQGALDRCAGPKPTVAINLRLVTRWARHVTSPISGRFSSTGSLRLPESCGECQVQSRGGDDARGVPASVHDPYRFTFFVDSRLQANGYSVPLCSRNPHTTVRVGLAL